MLPQKATQSNQAGTVNEQNIDRVEKEALESAKRTIQAMEQAIAAWDASKEKPKELEESYRRYKWMREELSKWARGFLMKSGRPRTFEERLSDLRRLARISFSGVG